MIIPAIQSSSFGSVQSRLTDSSTEQTNHPCCPVLNEIVLKAVTYLIDETFKQKLRKLPETKLEELRSLSTLFAITTSHSEQCQYAEKIREFCESVSIER